MTITKIKITELDNNIQIYGISTQLDDYKLSWLINHNLNTRLNKTNNYIANKVGLTYDLNFSAYQSVTNSSNILLVSNKTDNSVRLINIPSIDFILKIDNTECNIKDFITKLRALKGIIAITDLKNNINIQKRVLKEVSEFLK